MINPHGYAVIVSPEAMVERDTVTCGHCQRVVFVKPGTAATVYLVRGSDGQEREEAGAFCRVCMRSVCLRCHDDGRCLPWERQIEQMESR